MTMKRSRRTIPAGEFKARCLGYLDQVARSGEILVITKRGRPVAQVAPIQDVEPVPLEGSVKYHGDIVDALDEAWEAAG
jgi:prevent-host-death family protein